MLKRNYAVLRDMMLIDIDYNYNYRKVIYFIATEDAGITNDVITYISNYPDPLSNVAIIPVALTLLMSKIFGSVNEVDSHTE